MSKGVYRGVYKGMTKGMYRGVCRGCTGGVQGDVQGGVQGVCVQGDARWMQERGGEGEGGCWKKGCRGVGVWV